MAKLKYSVRFVSFPCIHRTMTPRRIIGNHPESITVLANEPDGHRKVALTSLKQPEKGQNTGKKKLFIYPFIRRNGKQIFSIIPSHYNNNNNSKEKTSSRRWLCVFCIYTFSFASHEWLVDV